MSNNIHIWRCFLLLDRTNVENYHYLAECCARLILPLFVHRDNLMEYESCVDAVDCPNDVAGTDKQASLKEEIESKKNYCTTFLYLFTQKFIYEAILEQWLARLALTRWSRFRLAKEVELKKKN